MPENERVSDASTTVTAAILDGVVETAHLTGLQAGPAPEAMVAAIRESLFSPAFRWSVVQLAAERDAADA